MITILKKDDVLPLDSVPRVMQPPGQPKESKLCGQYAAAWVLGISPFIAVQHLGNGSTFEEEMLLALNRIAWSPDWYEWITMHPAAPAMLLGKDLQGGLHWIGYRDGKFYDPLQGRRQYIIRAILQPEEPRKTAQDAGSHIQSKEPEL